jgi:hypothetical protein
MGKWEKGKKGQMNESTVEANKSAKKTKFKVPNQTSR